MFAPIVVNKAVDQLFKCGARKAMMTMIKRVTLLVASNTAVATTS